MNTTALTCIDPLQNDLTPFKQWLDEYTQDFLKKEESNPSAVVLKIKHSERVCAEITQLAQSLRLTPRDEFIARLMGLFHDIGRFIQFSRYRTFSDAISVNHAKLGVQQLALHHVLTAFPRFERKLILNAIFYHNACTLPKHLDDRALFFGRLLRDADKLDILRIFMDFYLLEDKTGKEFIALELPDNDTYSPKILDAIFKGKIALMQNMKSMNDFKLLKLSWIFDINFDPALQSIAENDYIAKIEKLLPQTNDIKAAIDHVSAYITKRLAGYPAD